MADLGNFINAKSFGASGSLFETWAETVSGSNRILVGDVGDFAIGEEREIKSGEEFMIYSTVSAP